MTSYWPTARPLHRLHHEEPLHPPLHHRCRALTAAAHTVAAHTAATVLVAAAPAAAPLALAASRACHISRPCYSHSHCRRTHRRHRARRRCSCRRVHRCHTCRLSRSPPLSSPIAARLPRDPPSRHSSPRSPSRSNIGTVVQRPTRPPSPGLAVTLRHGRPASACLHRDPSSPGVIATHRRD